MPGAKVPPILIPVDPVHGAHSRSGGASARDVYRLVSEIENIIDLENTKLSDSFFYSSIVLCVIDAVYSISAKYDSTKKVPQRWCEFAGWELLRGDEIPEHSVSDFLKLIEPLTDEELAKDVFKNRQRTSTRSGILKSAAVRQFAEALQAEGIDHFTQLRSKADLGSLEARVRSIPGQKSGISFDYFLMLAGSDDYVKADRWICRFVAKALGVPEVPPRVANNLLIDAAHMLRETNSAITPRSLDHAIWNYMVQA